MWSISQIHAEFGGKNGAISAALNMQLNKVLIKVSVKKWVKLETKTHCLVQLLTVHPHMGKDVGGQSAACGILKINHPPIQVLKHPSDEM